MKPLWPRLDAYKRQTSYSIGIASYPSAWPGRYPIASAMACRSSSPSSALGQRQPQKEGCFRGVHALPQGLGIAFTQCSLKLAPPVWIFRWVRY